MRQILKKILPDTISKEFRDYNRRKRNIKYYDPLQFKNPIYQTSFAGFDYYKCIFIHIPKNAGLSICYSLFGNTGGSHRKIKDYQDVFSKRTFKEYYKFTFVRNPWDRLVSTYFFLKKGGLTEEDALWYSENLDQFNDFESFVKEWLTLDNINSSLHFQPQYSYLETAEGNLEIDFIGKFENIEADFLKVTKKLGIERSLKKTNASNREKDYRSYYNEETKDIVFEIYKKDIQLFKYEF